MINLFYCNLKNFAKSTFTKFEPIGFFLGTCLGTERMILQKYLKI